VHEPTVSVVIPTYNRAAFLGPAVASIREQTLPCNEIVIVDDGSTDDTEAVVATLGPGIRYVRQSNAGPAVARNRGIRETQTDLVGFLDTDDRWLPEKLALQVEVMKRHPSVALVCADMAIEDDSGKQLVDSNFEKRGMKRLFEDLDGKPIPDAPRRLLEINFVNTSTTLIRRDVLVALNSFDDRLRYGEDLELWLRIAAKHDLACLPSVQEIRVEHATNVTKSIEPMLLDYVRRAEIVGEWASGLLPAWGTTAADYLADSLNDLGYWYFSQDRLVDARRALWRSFRTRPTARALGYGTASWLPPWLIAAIRALKAGD
jgi:glycosyltransferase involved in cell wall biosynthesis